MNTNIFKTLAQTELFNSNFLFSDDIHVYLQFKPSTFSFFFLPLEFLLHFIMQALNGNPFLLIWLNLDKQRKLTNEKTEELDFVFVEQTFSAGFKLHYDPKCLDPQFARLQQTFPV